ncbi:uncharacterized protein FFE2_12671 [Fusarium fujikuroi]|nr:uncharacterized protein FFE2_12671 [Fusarium fujikuroi]SCO22410.1 uncharacterized protein FFC1_14373 [Fusarium fujikuroi]SCV57350.1 uncharacterized protein FFFS_12680 [Fusarium fujikuroi]
MEFSLDHDASLFGLDDTTDQHQLKLNAANAFSKVRKALDRNNTILRTLTVRQFSRRKTNKYFIDNVTKLVQKDDKSRAIWPLIYADSLNRNNSIDQLILVLFTLTDTLWKDIKDNSLVNIFAELYSRVVGNVEIFPEMRAKLVDIIKDICHKNMTEDGQNLLGHLDAPRTKRRRIDPYERESCILSRGIPVINLRPECLVPPQIDHPDIPPDHVPKTVVVQFSEAHGGRLGAVLGDSPMLKAMKVGRQWCWERQRDAVTQGATEMRTDAIIAMIPGTATQDITFVLRVGYWAGWEITKYLGFGSSGDMETTT